MRKKILQLSLVFGFALCYFSGFGQLQKSAKELEDDGKKRFGIESGRIKYEYSDKGSGSEMVHFDRWGWLEMREVDMTSSLLNKPFAQKRQQLLDGTQQILHTDGSNYASVSMERFLSTAVQKSSPAVEVLFGEEALKIKGAKRSGSEEILGRRCTIYEVATEGSKVWVWKGIILRVERKVFDNRMVMEATMIDEEWKPKKEVFEMPAGLVGLPEK